MQGRKEEETGKRSAPLCGAVDAYSARLAKQRTGIPLKVLSVSGGSRSYVRISDDRESASTEGVHE